MPGSHSFCHMNSLTAEYIFMQEAFQDPKCENDEKLKKEKKIGTERGKALSVDGFRRCRDAIVIRTVLLDENKKCFCSTMNVEQLESLKWF